MHQRAFRIFDTATPATGSQITAWVEWPGGAGWLDVSGTFTGASAQINTSVAVEAGPLGSLGVSPLPDFPTGIVGPGLYKFECPKGTLKFTSSTLAGGDTLVVTANVFSVGC